MKKKIYSSVIALFLVFFLVSCAQSRSKKMTQENIDPTYSNLVDSESQEIVTNQLTEAGVSKVAVQSFFSQVDLFNSIMRKNDFLKEGFENNLTIEPVYDPYAMQEV